MRVGTHLKETNVRPHFSQGPEPEPRPEARSPVLGGELVRNAGQDALDYAEPLSAFLTSP